MSPLLAEEDNAISLGQSILSTLSGVLLGSSSASLHAAISVLSGGHLLIQDVPGVGKTVLATAIARLLGVPNRRIQGHPDLLPSDICGVNIWSSARETWEFHPGPIFASVVLLDELNRTPPHTQSALLEAMAEKHVSIGDRTLPLPSPHLVIATQNPEEQTGTFPLTESQLDRFSLCTSIGYPDRDAAVQLILSGGAQSALDSLEPLCGPEGWQRLQQATSNIFVDPALANYMIDITTIINQSAAGEVKLGVSPRGTIQWMKSAQALALLEGVTYVRPTDIYNLAIPSLAHRIIVSGHTTPDAVITKALNSTHPPRL